MSYQLPQKFNGPYRQEVASTQQVSNPDIETPSDQIQFQFPHQNLNHMDKFDVHQIYANKDIQEINKYRSDFIFLIPIMKRGSRHLIAIDKTQIIWSLLKIICLSLICYYLCAWIATLQNIHQIAKIILLYSIKSLPFILFIVCLFDPGFVLNHEIYESQYQSTDDKRRPKDGKYCQQCKIFIRRRTSHCFKCNHCVSQFDHHCGIMARCVGRFNALPFYSFAVLANLIYMASIMLVIYEFIIA